MTNIFIHTLGAGAYLACLWYAAVLWTGRGTPGVPSACPHSTGSPVFAPEVNGVRGGVRADGTGALLSVQVALACGVSLCLLFLPAGRLPALVRLPWALGMAGAVLACGVGVFLPLMAGDAGKSRRLLVGQWVFFLTALAVLVLFAMRRGLPGDLGSVDSFVATPVWAVASGWSTAGLCGILAGMALCLPSMGPVRALARCRFFSGCVFLLWALMAHGLAVSLLVPWHLSAFFDLGLGTGLALDVLGFWGKVAVSVALASRVVPETRRVQWAGIALLIVGQAVLVHDVVWGG